MARYLSVPVQFVRIRSIRVFEERGGSFFVEGHIAVGYSKGDSTLVADMPGLVMDWRLALYETISDEEAATLFYSNRAVDSMEEGDLAGAAGLLRFLTEVEPSVPNPWSNLGVVLLRQKKYEEALALLQRAIARFPDFQPLYVNGALAANRAGHHELSEFLAERGRSLSNDDPYLLFGQGLNELARRNAASAAALFEEAARLKPDSVLFLVWLVRASLSAGEPTVARAAFRRAREIAPNFSMIRELQSSHPELEVPEHGGQDP
jgi:tetratricopeptide (TPR) repeat protein